MSQVTHEAVTATMIIADIQVTCALAACAILSPLRSRNTDWKHSVHLHLIKYKVKGISHASKRPFTPLHSPSLWLRLQLCGGGSYDTPNAHYHTGASTHTRKRARDLRFQGDSNEMCASRKTSAGVTACPKHWTNSRAQHARKEVDDVHTLSYIRRSQTSCVNKSQHSYFVRRIIHSFIFSNTQSHTYSSRGNAEVPVHLLVYFWEVGETKETGVKQHTNKNLEPKSYEAAMQPSALWFYWTICKYCM